MACLFAFLFIQGFFIMLLSWVAAHLGENAFIGLFLWVLAIVMFEEVATGSRGGRTGGDAVWPFIVGVVFVFLGAALVFGWL